MHLGIHAWRLQNKLTGVGRYLLNIIRHWDGDGSRVFDRIRLYTSRSLDRQDLGLPAGLEVRVLGPDFRMLLWENLRLGPWIRDDVLFCPSHSRPVTTRSRVVVTLHDSTQFLYPRLFGRSQRLYNRLYLWSARHATLVITDTRAALEDLAGRCGVPEAKMRVVHMAAAEVFAPLDEGGELEEAQRRLVGGSEPYFLFVGKFSGRRSIPLLLRAFAEFKRRAGAAHKLVLVGLNIHRLDIHEMIGRLGIADEVRYPGFVSDEDLNVLYNGSAALVSSAIYETVSLPVMEAQAAGAPVICVDTAGMRETTGGAALLIRRAEVAEMAEAMTRIAGDPSLRRELSEAGLENSRQFSWRRTAEETMKVLEEAAEMTKGAASR